MKPQALQLAQGDPVLGVVLVSQHFTVMSDSKDSVSYFFPCFIEVCVSVCVSNWLSRWF